jgi:hypothetical protein
MTVPAASIVEDLDVIENIGASEISCFVDAFADAFFFKAAEEGLGHHVIPAISAPAHAGQQVVGTAEANPVVTAILAALIRMHDHRLRGFTSPHGH